VRAAEASRDGATRQPRFSLTPVIEQFADDRLWQIAAEGQWDGMSATGES